MIRWFGVFHLLVANVDDLLQSLSARRVSLGNLCVFANINEVSVYCSIHAMVNVFCISHRPFPWNINLSRLCIAFVGRLCSCCVLLLACDVKNLRIHIKRSSWI